MHMKAIQQLIAGSLFVFMVIVGCAATQNSPGQDKATAEAARNLGEAYLQESKLTPAMREFKKAEALDPDNPFLQYDLGLVHLYRGRYDDAIAHFERALALKPDYPAAMNSMGNAYLRKKDYDRAIVYYKKTTEDMLYATPQYPLSNMALAYYEKGEYGLAEKYFLEALKLDADFDRALAGLAETYMATGRYAEAIEKLQSAVHISPNAPTLHYLLARAYMQFGDYRGAYLEFNKVVELAPNTVDAEKANQELKKLELLLK